MPLRLDSVLCDITVWMANEIVENSKNAPFRKDKILTSVPRSAFFDGESRSRFGFELTEELEAAMSSSNALMSTIERLEVRGCTGSNASR